MSTHALFEGMTRKGARLTSYKSTMSDLTYVVLVMTTLQVHCSSLVNTWRVQSTRRLVSTCPFLGFLSLFNATLTPPPCLWCLQDATSTFRRACNLGHVYFTFLPPAFQFGQRKKQADASGLASLPFPTLSLSSENFTQLEINFFIQSPELLQSSFFRSAPLMSSVHSNLPRQL